MTQSVNKVLLLGTVNEPPHVAYTQNGLMVATVNLLTVDSYKDKVTEDIHKISFFGKQAENVNAHLAEGKKVFIEAKLRTRVNSDRNGKQYHNTDVTGLSFIALTPERLSTPQDKPEQGFPTEFNDDDAVPF